MSVDCCPGLGFAAGPRRADAGEDGRDGLVAENEQGSNGSDGVRLNGVASRSANLGDEAFGPELLEVVRGVANGVIARLAKRGSRTTRGG